MTKNNWTSARIRQSLLSQIEELLKKPTIEKFGITNPSQFVDLAVREKLDKLEAMKN